MTLRTKLLIALSLSAGPLAAQGGVTVMRSDDVLFLRPRSCPLADSVLGRTLERPRERAYGYRTPRSSLVMSSDPNSITGKRPIDAILLNAMRPRGAGWAEVGFSFQLRLKDTVVRSGSSALLTLFLDDTAEVRVGTMSASSVTPQTWNDKIDQMLLIPFPSATTRALILATTVRGRLGATDFEVPAKTLDSFRSVYLSMLCDERM
jgi:hypothetical protein